MWNAAMIATLVMFGARHDAAAAGGAAGVGLGRRQRAAVRRAAAGRAAGRAGSAARARHRRPTHVRTVGRNFVPVFVSRGVVQVSAYVDQLLASLLPTGAVTGAAERATAVHAAGEPVRHVGVGRRAAGDVGRSPAPIRRRSTRSARRLDAGLRRIAFFVVPSAVAFLALGDVVAGALFQTGRFNHSDAVYVWGILAGSAVGLLASTLGRLYSSTYYALRDTRTPLRYARRPRGADDGARLSAARFRCRGCSASRPRGARRG